MRVVIIADTHGDLMALRRVSLIENAADIYLHAGDVEAAPGDITPFAAVRGNCDGAFPAYPLRYETMTPYGPLLMQHHPLAGPLAFARLQKEGIRLFVHGHTHEKEARLVGGIWFFCPGSLVYPHDGGRGSYLVLEISSASVQAFFKEAT
jgi:putative phosphoesterase